jgi:hypothetical protein
MSSDLLKEHLKAVADRLNDKSIRNAKVVKPSKKSDSIRKSERAVNYIGWFYLLLLSLFLSSFRLRTCSLLH